MYSYGHVPQHVYRSEDNLRESFSLCTLNRGVDVGLLDFTWWLSLQPWGLSLISFHSNPAIGLLSPFSVSLQRWRQKSWEQWGRKQEKGTFETNLCYIDRLSVLKEKREREGSSVFHISAFDWFCTILTFSCEHTWFDIRVSCCCAHVASGVVVKWALTPDNKRLGKYYTDSELYLCWLGLHVSSCSVYCWVLVLIWLCASDKVHPQTVLHGIADPCKYAKPYEVSRLSIEIICI